MLINKEGHQLPSEAVFRPADLNSGRYNRKYNEAKRMHEHTTRPGVEGMRRAKK